MSNHIKAEIVRLMREEFDPCPPNYGGHSWQDCAEEVADSIVALFASPQTDLVSRAEVLRVLERLGGQDADLALYGAEDNARAREYGEAAMTRACCAVAIMPASPDLSASLAEMIEGLVRERDEAREMRKRLDKRIHCQRKANRDNWEIVEQRRKWLGSQTAQRAFIRMRDRALAAEARIKALEERETFLRSRRGALVIERDAARAHAENLIAAIENDGKTSSLHDWDARMKRAVADARQALSTLGGNADAGHD